MSTTGNSISENTICLTTKGKPRSTEYKKRYYLLRLGVILLLLLHLRWRYAVPSLLLRLLVPQLLLLLLLLCLVSCTAGGCAQIRRAHTYTIVVYIIRVYSIVRNHQSSEERDTKKLQLTHICTRVGHIEQFHGVFSHAAFNPLHVARLPLQDLNVLGHLKRGNA